MFATVHRSSSYRESQSTCPSWSVDSTGLSALHPAHKQAEALERLVSTTDVERSHHDHRRHPTAVTSSVDLGRPSRTSSIDRVHGGLPFRSDRPASDAIAVLWGTHPPASVVLVLRAKRGGLSSRARHGPQSLGLRSMTFNVGSLGETRSDRVLLAKPRPLHRSTAHRRRRIGPSARTRSGQLASGVRLLRQKDTIGARSTTNRLSAFIIRWTPDPRPTAVGTKGAVQLHGVLRDSRCETRGHPVGGSTGSPRGLGAAHRIAFRSKGSSPQSVVDMLALRGARSPDLSAGGRDLRFCHVAVAGTKETPSTRRERSA